MILIVAFVLGTGISFISILQRSVSLMHRLVEKISTFKIVRKERAERARKLVKQKQAKEAREEVGEITPPMVVEKPSAPTKKEAIVEQTAFEFLEAKKAFQFPPLSLLEAEVEKRQKIDRTA